MSDAKDKDNGKKSIAEQLKNKDEGGNPLYPNLSILGFSMGTTFAFWIINALGNDFKGKISIFFND